MHRKLTDLYIVWPETVALQKASTSMCMSKDQQTLTRAAQEMSPQKDSILDLKRIAIKLFGNQSKDVCQAGETREVEEEYDETEWELTAARVKSSKARGGNVRKSIKSTQNLYGFMGPSKRNGKQE